MIVSGCLYPTLAIILGQTITAFQKSLVDAQQSVLLKDGFVPNYVRKCTQAYAHGVFFCDCRYTYSLCAFVIRYQCICFLLMTILTIQTSSSSPLSALFPFPWNGSALVPRRTDSLFESAIVSSIHSLPCRSRISTRTRTRPQLSYRSSTSVLVTLWVWQAPRWVQSSKAR
jgi:hypothetical protein